MIKLFLTGDVMLGRGIDQILRYPGDPQLYESYIKSAQGYIELAERSHGPIPRGVDLHYVWGDTKSVLATEDVDWGIVNLETAITSAGTPEPKGINYRMNPPNALALKQLGIDCCVLANNHVLDWEQQGLMQTLDTLQGLGIATAGAGRNAEEAAAPARLRDRDGPSVLVFAFAALDSGVPRHWPAKSTKPGISVLSSFDDRQINAIRTQVLGIKNDGDIAIASIHWGGNWGYDVRPEHATFAHALIDEAAIDIVHGHSSHHAKGWEIHHGKLILYGCGDFINDYEGIGGQEEYRSDLALMYVLEIDEVAGGALTSLSIFPFQIGKFRLNRASPDDTHWLCAMLNRQCRSPNARFHLSPAGVLDLHLN